MRSGIPIQSRSQSSTASSSADAPAPPVQLPANVLWPVPIRSASTLTGLLGLPMRAKKRGWSARWPRGRIASKSSSIACWGSLGPSGQGGDRLGGPRRVGGRDRRLRVERLPAIDEPVPHVVPERAQLVGRKAQRVHVRDNRAMRAAVMQAFEEPLVIEDVPDPVGEPDGVVVAVRATGVCRSDWHAWMGHDPSIVLPHVPGHELCGEVVAAGPAVRGFAVGDRVTVPFCCGCGACEPCRLGETQICERDFQPGFTAWGSFAELVALPRADLNLVRGADGAERCRGGVAGLPLHDGLGGAARARGRARGRVGGGARLRRRRAGRGDDRRGGGRERGRGRHRRAQAGPRARSGRGACHRPTWRRSAS